MDTLDQAFEDWKRRANEADLLQTAQSFGAQLKRTGAEWVGPCPGCGGKDRFSINPSKHKWNCRGAEGGSTVVGMVMHIAGLSFLEACQELTGEPPPKGRAKPLSPAEQEDRRRRKQAADEERAARDAAEAERRQRKAEDAASIWEAAKPIEGTLAETYLIRRGLIVPPQGWPDVLRFAPSLTYELDDDRPRYPALVARVDDPFGQLTAIWRIYLQESGDKIDRDPAKVGLGPAAGGAVRLGGIGPKVGIAEGIETALAAWAMNGFKYPVWSVLSTSGMINFEPPPELSACSIFPDGDNPFRMQDGDYVLCEPPGRHAARLLHDRLIPLGIKAPVQPEPPIGQDYLDMLKVRRALMGAA